MQANPLLSWPPKPSSGLPLAFLLASQDLELVLAFLDLELVLAFPDLELVLVSPALGLVLVFLALGQVQVQDLDPWLLLKQPNMAQAGLEASEGLEVSVEQVSQAVLVVRVSQAVLEVSDLLAQLLLPRLLPKLANTASGEPVDSELEGLELEGLELEAWDLEGLGLVESQGPGALEVCPQLQLLKQPNMVPVALEVS